MPQDPTPYPADLRVRWPGSGSNPSGSTPFGFYDADTQFQYLAPRAASWAAKMLGYPIIDVEMLDVNFYACLEGAINEYGNQVNQFNIINNISLLQGLPTTTTVSGQNIQGMGLSQQIQLAQGYGTEAGVGGYVSWKTGSIRLYHGIQQYDLQSLWGDVIESGSRIEIKRIFHYAPPASARIYDPFSMTGMSYSNIMNEMGFAGFSPATQFLMTPIFEDLLRIQAIEFNDTVRKSAYSFELVNNKVRIFPIPTFGDGAAYCHPSSGSCDGGYGEFGDGFDDFADYNDWYYGKRLHFEYIVVNDRNLADANLFPSQQSSGSVISDYSNVPYQIIPFSNINSPGQQWIYKYFLANCKEVLGAIRQKYQTIPVPGAEVTLDGAELRQEASAEKAELITQLRENLEATTRKSQLSTQSEEADQLQNVLKKIPTLIYVG